MQVAAGFLMFIIAFAMLFAGIGLLIGGEITFKSGKKIPKPAGRKAAVALVSFIPLFVVARTVLRWFDPEHAVPIESISWPLAGACLVLAGTWVLRGMAPNKPRSSYSSAAPSSPFELSDAFPAQEIPAEASPAAPAIVPEFDMPADAPPAAAPAARRASAKRRGKDPFDFS